MMCRFDKFMSLESRTHTALLPKLLSGELRVSAVGNHSEVVA